MNLVDYAVARSQREILADMAEGTVPADVATFSELHDYVDANVYGGLCDEDLFPSFVGIDHELACANLVQDRVDEWLRAGARPAEMVKVDPPIEYEVKVVTRFVTPVVIGDWVRAESRVGRPSRVVITEGVYLGVMESEHPDHELMHMFQGGRIDGTSQGDGRHGFPINQVEGRKF